MAALGRAYNLCSGQALSLPSTTARAQARFNKVPGVIRTKVGYTGGPARSKPVTYDTVCAGDGHTEALRIWFDPNALSYKDLLKLFFEEHNPTYKSKPQYKSALWYHTPEQKAAIEQYISQMEQKYGVRVATTVDSEQPWHDAEEYHQNYIEKMRGRW